MWSFGRNSFSPRAPHRWWRASATGDGGLGRHPGLRLPTDPTQATAVLHSTTHHRPAPLRWVSEPVSVGFIFAGLGLLLSFPLCPSQSSASWHQETAFFIICAISIVFFISLWFRFICSLISVRVYCPCLCSSVPHAVFDLHACVFWFAIVPHRPNT